MPNSANAARSRSLFLPLANAEIPHLEGPQDKVLLVSAGSIHWQ
jgi:hypothetical protein